MHVINRFHSPLFISHHNDPNMYNMSQKCHTVNCFYSDGWFTCDQVIFLQRDKVVTFLGEHSVYFIYNLSALISLEHKVV